MRKRLVPVALHVDLADDELVAAAADGDDDAFATLFRRHAGDVLRTIERRCGSPALAEDVTAAAFEKAWRSLDDIRRRRIGFRPWVFRLAINGLIDAQRASGRRERREQLIAADPAVALRDPDPDGLEPVRWALATLSEPYQEVLTMRYIAELTPAEIASALGVAKGTVAVRTHRATAALRRALESVAEGATA